MALDPRIEKIISTQIPAQFPSFYRDEFPIFVAFVETYYRWMESEGQVLYHSRRIPSYKDVDTTTSEFLTHFTQKYLTGIQLETESNARLMIKHSLDLFRSKGSERSLDLLFRLVFGVGADVYLSASDILRASDGQWVRPVYLETVDHGDNISDFVGYQIVGRTSGARGFVERVIRKKSGTKYVDIVFISDLVGSFQAGERFNREFAPVEETEAPTIIGSLSSLTVTSGGSGYSIGDVVDLESSTGTGGRGRVSATGNTLGSVEIDLIEGGYGYTLGSQVLISNVVLTVTDYATGPGQYYSLFDQVSQNKAIVTYDSGVGTFSDGDQVWTYDGGGVVTGTAVVTSITPTDPGEGSMRLVITSGNVEGGPFYGVGNAVSADQVSYSDETAEGRVIGTRGGVTVTFSDKTSPFSIGERVVGPTGSGVVADDLVSGIEVRGVDGRFSVGHALVGQESGSAATVSSVRIRVGLDQVSGSFMSGPSFVLQRGGINDGRVEIVSGGTGASASLYSLSDVETILKNDDLIAPFMSIELDDVYPFAAYPTANLATIIADCLTYSNLVIGKVASLVLTGAGEDYGTGPVIRIYEPLTATSMRTGWTVQYSGATGGFSSGEVVTQADTGARGLILGGNATHLTVQRMSWSANLTTTSGPGTTLVGTDSGSSTSLVSVSDMDPARDPLAIRITGADAEVATDASTADGTAVTVDIIDSGLGYVDGETVSFGSGLGIGMGIVRSSTHGVGTGYYRKKGGLLSGSKKLFDGEYYQEFSYEVRSSLALNRYRDMLRTVIHLAGTKMFGAFRSDSSIQVPVEAQASVVIG